MLRVLYISWLLAGTMLWFAIEGKHAHSFYETLRWTCCAVFVLSAVGTFHLYRGLGPFLFGALAVLFNPLIQFHFRRETWRMLDGISLALLILAGALFWKNLSKGSVLMRSVEAFALLMAGVTVGVFLFIQGAHVVQVIRGGASTLARVVEAFDDELEDSSGRSGLVTIAVYEFLANGNQFVGKTEGYQGEWSKGDNIEVEYNPQNPTQNRAKGDRGMIGSYVGLLLVGGAFSYWAITKSVRDFRGLFQIRTSSGSRPA